MSLDALRGFDMFWIVGAEELIRGLQKFSSGGLLGMIAEQLHHKAWAGFHFEDLIFPLFVFISGVSVVFSLTKETQLHGRAGALQRVVRRAALLFVRGIFYSGGFTKEWPEIRVLGVLQRIALAYLGAGLVFCFIGARMKALAAVIAGILVGYWGLMSFVPIRDIALDKAKLAEIAEQAGDARGAHDEITPHCGATKVHIGVVLCENEAAVNFIQKVWTVVFLSLQSPFPHSYKPTVTFSVTILLVQGLHARITRVHEVVLYYFARVDGKNHNASQLIRVHISEGLYAQVVNMSFGSLHCINIARKGRLGAGRVAYISTLCVIWKLSERI